MSWLTEWKAISAQIQGLFEVSRFYFETHGVLRYGDAHSVGYLELVPQTNKIWDTFSNLETLTENLFLLVPPNLWMLR